jgi:hypothetical protein
MSGSIDIYEPYILNETNIESYLKYKPINEVRVNKIKNNNGNNKYNDGNNCIVKLQNIFIPKEQDTLFWCYYIIKEGLTNYETQMHRNSLLAKQLKINIVNTIRENKLIVKTYKFDSITNLESNLANDDNINIKTIMTLCAIYNINLIYVSNKTYYELMMNDSDKIYIIKEINTTQNYKNSYKKYGFELAIDESINNIKNTLYRIDNINKPIKGLSSYKVQELIDIANKLAIEIKNNETGKNKSKNELYESIIQYF